MFMKDYGPTGRWGVSGKAAQRDLCQAAGRLHSLIVQLHVQVYEPTVMQMCSIAQSLAKLYLFAWWHATPARTSTMIASLRMCPLPVSYTETWHTLLRALASASSILSKPALHANRLARACWKRPRGQRCPGTLAAGELTHTNDT